jgi:hypothetical protein
METAPLTTKLLSLTVPRKTLERFKYGLTVFSGDQTLLRQRESIGEVVDIRGDPRITPTVRRPVRIFTRHPPRVFEQLFGRWSQFMTFIAVRPSLLQITGGAQFFEGFSRVPVAQIRRVV